MIIPAQTPPSDNFKKIPLRCGVTPAVQSGFVFLKTFPLKTALRFHLDDVVKEAMQDFLENQPRSFYSEDIDLLSKQWDLCYNAYGDFF
ncbi:hypothetical protein TNCV_1438131 [Trichonephila clavipes]|nr:hypothetical protein TNCV_1438131 [Trichonephila clavipes]